MIFLVFAFVAFIFLLCIGIIVLEIGGKYKVLEKSGEEGWKALIPVYSDYVFCKLTGVCPYWILIVYVGFALDFIPFVSAIHSIAIIYYRILMASSVAKSYGKSTSFAIGLFFLSPVFYAILGFGDSKYEGKKPMYDFIFKDQQVDFGSMFSSNNTNNNTNTVNNNNTQNNSSNIKFCPGCGAKHNVGDAFCASFGRQL